MMPRLSPRSWAVLLALSQFLIVLPLICTYPLGGSSEAREVHIAQIVFETGEIVLPLRDGLVPSKPPLFHWLAAAAGSVQGAVTSAVARMVSLGFGAGVLFLSMLMAFAVAEKGSESSKRSKYEIATLSAIILTTTFGFQNMIGDARVDMTYCFFVVLALYPILTAVSSESSEGLSRAELKDSWRWTLFFLAAGVGVLAKGPIAAVLPGAVLFASLCVAFGFRSAFSLILRPRIGWALFLASALPWYYFASRAGGEAFVHRQLFFENLKRFTGGELVNSEPWWYYAPEFLRTALPWSLFFIAALPAVFAALTSSQGLERGALRGQKKITALYALWFWVGFIIFSLASGKRQSYLLPLFPGMAVYLAFFLFERYETLTHKNRAVFRKFGSIGRGVLVASLLVLASFFEFCRIPGIWKSGIVSEVARFFAAHALSFEAVLSGAAVLIWLAHYLKWENLSRFSNYLGLVALVAVPVYSGLAVKNFMKGYDRAAVAITAQVAATEKLVVVREPREEYFDPLMYYVGRTVELRDVGKSLAECPTAFVAREADFLRLEERAKGTGRAVEALQRFYSLDKAYRTPPTDGFVLGRCR